MKRNLNLTLNEQHKNIINSFNSNINNIDNIKDELNKLKTGYELVKISENIKLKQEYIDKIKNLELDIINIENYSNESDYYIRTKSIIYNYYNYNTNDNNDIQNDINTNAIIPIYSKRKKISYVNNIMNFLSSPDDENNIKKNENNNISTKCIINNSYNNIINNTPLINNYKSNNCENCGCEKKISSNDGLSICYECGEIDHLIIESDIPNYRDNNTEKPIYPYKRLNHFMECLNQFQAKETINISEIIFNKILKEFKKIKVTNVKNITLTQVRNILKLLKLNKYYEHSSYILTKITKKPPPILKRSVEDDMKQMFKKIEISFNKFCPTNRSNFFNYHYILHKMFQLLKMSEYLEYFPLLKSKEKLSNQDDIWKKVCNDLGWKFDPSIN